MRIYRDVTNANASDNPAAHWLTGAFRRVAGWTELPPCHFVHQGAGDQFAAGQTEAALTDIVQACERSGAKAVVLAMEHGAFRVAYDAGDGKWKAAIDLYKQFVPMLREKLSKLRRPPVIISYCLIPFPFGWTPGTEPKEDGGFREDVRSILPLFDGHGYTTYNSELGAHWLDNLVRVADAVRVESDRPFYSIVTLSEAQGVPLGLTKAKAQLAACEAVGAEAVILWPDVGNATAIGNDVARHVRATGAR